MPEPEPVDPPRDKPERETLLAFLDYFRTVMIRKVEGVDDAGLRMSPVPSGTCLGGLIKHLAYVERWWFQAAWMSEAVEFPWTDEDPDADFRVEDHDTADTLIELYRGECARSREIVGDTPLDEVVVGSRGETSLRWIVVHMIEETARHAGHADLIREMIDGAVGD